MERKIEHKFTFNSEFDFVSRMVDIYTCMLPNPESVQLTHREKELFINYVLLHKEGYNLIDKQSVDKLEQASFKRANKGLSIYKGKLIKKGWIFPTKEGITIPNTFKYMFNDNNVVDMKVGLSLKYSENDDVR